jgi:hypothetical protein
MEDPIMSIDNLPLPVQIEESLIAGCWYPRLTSANIDQWPNTIKMMFDLNNPNKNNDPSNSKTP